MDILFLLIPLSVLLAGYQSQLLRGSPLPGLEASAFGFTAKAWARLVWPLLSNRPN